MGSTKGKKMPEMVGADVTDQSGNEHLGIIEFPVPILRGSLKITKQILKKLYQPDFKDLTVVDFSDLSQSCKTYDRIIDEADGIPSVLYLLYLQFFCRGVFTQPLWFVEVVDGPWAQWTELVRRSVVAYGWDIAKYAVTEDVLDTDVTQGACHYDPEESNMRLCSI